MLSRLNTGLAQARHHEFLDAARRDRAARAGWAEPPSWQEDRLWQGLTVRLATAADRRSLDRLAELDGAAPPSGRVLLGVVMARPVVALSLADGSVLADPFIPTRDLVELLRLRARQLRRS